MIPTTTTKDQAIAIPPGILTPTPRRSEGRCSFDIAPLSLPMRTPPNFRKDPIKSILKKSTAYPYSCVDHQHHFIQQNPRSTVKENGEKSALVQLLKEQAREFEEDRTRQLQEEEANYKRRLEERAEYWAKRKEDRIQWEQRADERYKREIKAQNKRFELFLKQVTGSSPIVLPPASTPISITNSADICIDDDDTDDKFTASITTEEESDPPADISIDNNDTDDEFTTSNTTEEEESDPPADICIDDNDTDNEFTTSITTEEEKSDQPADNIHIDDDDIPPTTIEEAGEQDSNATINDEEIPIPSGMFDIDNEFTTSNTTDEEDEDEKSNNYYDNIDNEIF